MENLVNESEVKEIKGTKKTAKAEEKKFLLVEREQYIGKDGKEYWSYIVKGQVRGRNVKINFAPKDKGGYEPLDIIFDICDKAELVMTNETMTDNNGNKTSYISYKVRTYDEDGLPFECSVKPSKDSDKSLLVMLLNQEGLAR